MARGAGNARAVRRFNHKGENPMSKSLRSMSESERKAAIARRLSSNTKGLGYWAAVDAQARLTKRAADLVAYQPLK
jgi:hypothetical protein